MKETSSDKLNYNILQLQNLIKRDAYSYYEEFTQQFQHYQSLLILFKDNPGEYYENVASLVMFLAQVSTYYKDELKDFPSEIMNILREYDQVLDPSMRMGFCKALILMRNRGIIDPTELITLCFELLRCKDKVLRKYLQIHIVADLKKINSKHKNSKVNSVLQNFMYKMLSDRNATAAKVSLDIMIELYKRHIWRDAKTVNAIATACFSDVNKILVAAHQFFLGVDEEEEKDSDSESEDDTPTVRDVMSANKVNKKTKKRMRILKRTKQVLKKSKKKKSKEVFDFSAIHLLHDPQGMAEKLLKTLQAMNERYEIKLMIMNLISRLVGIHELILLNFYPFLVRYMKPHQREVTKILMFAAQATHEHVPPDALEPVLRAISDNFITERNSVEVMTVGLNAVREICIRSPFCIDQDLLQDLVQYKKFKNKNVMMAARSLIQLYRKLNPKLLQRKFRGKPTEASKEEQPLEYGVLQAKSFIPGAEVLSLDPSKDEPDKKSKADEEENADDSDGSWIDVSHSADELSDAEEDDEEEDVENSIAEDDQNDEKISSSDKNKSGEGSNKEKAMAVSMNRILSQEEFKKVKIAQLSKQVKFAKGKKRKAAEEDMNAEELNRGEVVSLKDIEKLHKRPKPNKETRLATVLESREGREKFAKKNKKNPSAGKTQKEHNKRKAFMMIKHKVRSKTKRSFKDKQISLRNALLKRRKNK
ncbi:protein SDA1 homolog [Parasteatoda tepidariorum]|uniref:protein SDA1 homolog n=1 Tax=Parasteatoda tepidariorum TaxID=114398 RepID=UPI001C7200B4|nr:protein SDA1 homolog [Parasteatoda tepidariorum]